MKVSHTAELALVGWYLMLPPPALGGRRLIYEPLSEWKLIETFDSEKTCQQTLTKLIERMPDSGIDTARCVPSEYLTPDKPEVVGNRAGYQAPGLPPLIPRRTG
jgi:hypothetical protein